MIVGYPGTEVLCHNLWYIQHSKKKKKHAKKNKEKKVNK